MPSRLNHGLRFAWLACAGLLLQLVLLPILQSAGAAEIHWRTSDFNYVAQNKPLKEFIREFAADQGLNVVIAQDVEGTVNGKFNLTPQSMLDLLATSFGVSWYYDGNVLYVSSAADMSSEVLPLGAISADQLQAALNRLNIVERRYPISYDRGHNTARVAGPKRYVELVKQTVAALNESGEEGDGGGSASANGHSQIRVFPLRYAWAADFSYSADGQEHTLPGLVSVLRDLYTPTQTGSGRGYSTRQTKLDRMRGLGYFRDDQVPGPAPDRLAAVAPLPNHGMEASGGAAMEPVMQTDARLPQFQADGRMNAVIVRDVPERMAFYEAVIRSLDVRPGLVEIEASILEVSSDSIDSLGVSWRGQSGSASIRLSQAPPGGFNNNSTGSSNMGSTGSTGLPTTLLPNINTQGLTSPLIIPPTSLPTGGLLTTVLGDAGHYLMARINALAEDGKAKVVSTPKVITLDNVEAVLENLSTFYVPVAGNLDVGLYNVSAGVSLRVTPLIVTENGRTEIKLAVRVEDGGLTQQTVSNLPVVQRSTITTQAFIQEGQSLLIGGFKSEVHNDTQVGVPGLSSIPVVGHLFKHNQKEVSHMERLFMVTPRVVNH